MHATHTVHARVRLQKNASLPSFKPSSFCTSAPGCAAMGLFMDSTDGGIYLFIVSETVNYPIRRSLSARRQIVTQGGQISSPLWTKLINMIPLPLPIPHLLVHRTQDLQGADFYSSNKGYPTSPQLFRQYPSVHLTPFLRFTHFKAINSQVADSKIFLLG